MPIKSFRGKIASGGTDTISLHTNNGSTGYIIKKIQIISADPGGDVSELVFKIHSISTAVTSTLDFSDQTLLGIAYYQNVPVQAGAQGQSPISVIVFDNMVTNQDIYLQATDVSGNSVNTNYYIELEQVKLDLNANTTATLKDIRNIASQ
tara:strand:+ start:21 stop:470 length:450 start_codon:yes stop_codon:yes gene_type:complete